MSYTQLKARLKALAGPDPIDPPDTEQEFSRQLPQLLSVSAARVRYALRQVGLAIGPFHSKKERDALC